MKRTLALVALLILAGFVAADSITIPTDQPICKLYGLIQVFATVGGVLLASYSGYQLATSNDANERNSAKNLIGGIVIGLIIIWIAPLFVKSLVGATNICGW